MDWCLVIHAYLETTHACSDIIISVYTYIHMCVQTYILLPKTESATIRAVSYPPN